MRTMRTELGREIRLYPNVLEIWQDGVRVVALTPQEWGQINRWIKGNLEDVAQESVFGGA